VPGFRFDFGFGLRLGFWLGLAFCQYGFPIVLGCGEGIY